MSGLKLSAVRLHRAVCRCWFPGTVRRAGSDTQQRDRRAADLALKLRREREDRTHTPGPRSGLQRRVEELKQLSRQLQNLHPNVFAKALSRSVLYQDPNLIAINKPYGVPVHSITGIRNSISDSLPILSRIIDGMKASSKLHVCYSLEKDITGVLFLSRTEAGAEHIRHLISSQRAERKCMAITVGVPVPSEGLIDIPLIEREVMGVQRHYKMGLSPLYKTSDAGEELIRIRAHRQSLGAVTQYRVLDSNSGCSLVELHPTTGVKHQLRVHMALALSCPILGDHKYAQWNKLAPQKLPERVLQRLELEPSKTRYLPLHLHVRQITLPELKGHGDLTVFCPLPKYFVSTLKKLQLALPEKQ